MQKRTFLKTTSAVIAGGILSPFTACQSPSSETTTATALSKASKAMKNWAGNLTYSTENVHFPTSVEAVVELVQKLSTLRALGSQHSFNKVADSKHNLMSLREMKKIVSLDKTAQTVTVEAGVRYGDICEYLHENGFALHNLASLPHISIAGACATSTHGSGLKNGALAVGIKAVEMVKADGNIIQLDREKDGEEFNGAVVGLGALGIVTKLTLDLQPTFQMEQLVYRNLPMNALEENFETIMSSGYSVSLFTTWENKNVNQVWIKSKIDNPAKVSGSDFFGAQIADRHMHPLDDHSAESCTDQMGIAGPWFERLPHFKMGFTPSSGEELQAEYFVPLENGYQAMVNIEKLNKQITPHLFVSEIRTISADNYWMSPFYKKPCVAIHFTFKPEWEAIQKLLPEIESALGPFHARPHWGKLFTMTPSVLQSRIDKLNDFKDLISEYDPKGKLRNEFIQHNLFGV